MQTLLHIFGQPEEMVDMAHTNPLIVNQGRGPCIRVILQRSPAFQPAMKLSDSWLWTMEEIDRLANRRGQRQKRKQ